MASAQLRAADGLRHVGREAGAREVGAGALLVHGREQDQRRRRHLRRGFHLRGETHAVAVGHLIVGDEHVERRAGGLRVLQRLECFGAGGRGNDVEARRLKLAA